MEECHSNYTRCFKAAKKHREGEPERVRASVRKSFGAGGREDLLI